MIPPNGTEHRAIVDTHRHPIGPKLAAKMAERGFYDRSEEHTSESSHCVTSRMPSSA